MSLDRRVHDVILRVAAHVHAVMLSTGHKGDGGGGGGEVCGGEQGSAQVQAEGRDGVPAPPLTADGHLVASLHAAGGEHAQHWCICGI